MTYEALPVMIQTRMIHQNGMTIYYPEIYDIKNTHVQEIINTEIYNLMRDLIELQSKEQGFNYFNQMIGSYEIKTNERNILSLSLSNYAISKHAAHGITLIKSLTFNMETGKLYTLADLFTPESNYIKVLSSLIQKQITARDIPLLNGFNSIRPDQDFYIADKSLVIYFQLYEITPYYVGLPMFPISVFELEHIARANGPIDIMATNN